MAIVRSFVVVSSILKILKCIIMNFDCTIVRNGKSTYNKNISVNTGAFSSLMRKYKS